MSAGCPHCGAVLELSAMLDEEAELQVHGLELRCRALLSKVTKLEHEREAQAVSKRDGAVWRTILEAYREVFPDKRLSAVGIKSARATAVFLRMEQGATVEDWLDAIRGGKEYPYVVFGKRVRSGSRSDLANDLQHFAAINRDHEFEFLRDAGRAVRIGAACDAISDRMARRAGGLDA